MKITNTENTKEPQSVKFEPEENLKSTRFLWHKLFEVQNRSELLNLFTIEIRKILAFHNEPAGQPILLRKQERDISVMFVTTKEFNLSTNSLLLYSDFQAFEKLLNSNAERRNLNLRFWFHQIGSENLDYKALRSDGYKYVYKLGRFIELNTTENEN